MPTREGDQETAFRYALDGFSGRASEWWLAAIGGVVGWIALYVTGQQMIFDHLLPSNALLANAIVLLICVGAGEALVFIGRLLYFPIRRCIRAPNNVFAVLRTSLGVHMWPVLLMGLGVALFGMLFSAGLIWFVFQTAKSTLAEKVVYVDKPIYIEKPQTNIANAAPSKPIAKDLSHLPYEDEVFRVDLRKFILTDCTKLFEMIQLATYNYNFTNKDFERLAMTFANGSYFIEVWQDMFTYANKPVSEIDPDVLSAKLSLSLKLYRMAKLTAYAMTKLQDPSDSKGHLEQWTIVDRKASGDFEDLRITSPQRFQLIMSQDIFGGF